MTKEKLKYLSIKEMELLHSSIHENENCYKSGDFNNLSQADSWNIEIEDVML